MRNKMADSNNNTTLYYSPYVSDNYGVPYGLSGSAESIFRVALIPVDLVAIVLNIVMLTTLIRVSNLLPPLTRILMIHQSLVEIASPLANCTMQAIYVFSVPLLFMTSVECITRAQIFWVFDTMVQWNCMLITLDRYFAVCFAMKRMLNKLKVLLMILAVHVFAWGYNYFSETHAYVIDGRCVYVSNGRDIYYVLGTMYMVFIDGAPILAMLIFYPQMISHISKSSKSLNLQSDSKVHAAASRKLTRTCFLAGSVLVATNVPDIVVYTFLYCYLQSSLYNYLTSLLIVMSFKGVYPLISPVIYCFSTEKFRAAVRSAFCST